MVRFREGHFVEMSDGRIGEIVKIMTHSEKLGSKLKIYFNDKDYPNEEVYAPEVKLVGWIMPEWMEDYRTYLASFTGGNPIEELMNDHHSTSDNNLVRAMICVSFKSVVSLLERLYKNGHLKVKEAA